MILVPPPMSTRPVARATAAIRRSVAVALAQPAARRRSRVLLVRGQVLVEFRRIASCDVQGSGRHEVFLEVCLTRSASSNAQQTLERRGAICRPLVASPFVRYLGLPVRAFA